MGHTVLCLRYEVSGRVVLYEAEHRDTKQVFGPE